MYEHLFLFIFVCKYQGSYKYDLVRTPGNTRHALTLFRALQNKLNLFIFLLTRKIKLSKRGTDVTLN